MLWSAPCLSGRGEENAMRMKANALLALWLLCGAGCAAPQLPAATCPTPEPDAIRLDVRLVEIETDIARVGPAGMALAQAALLHLQQRLLAGGSAGHARFAIAGAALDEQPLPEGDGIPPAARFEARLVYVAELSSPARQPQPPVRGEARCSLVMVGLPSSTERNWAFQQVTHGAITNMDRALVPMLDPWRLGP